MDVVKIINNGTILPARYFTPIYKWGLGGVLDENNNFVEDTHMMIPHKFGGKYEYEEEDCDYIEGSVIYIGPLRTHWGHFLIDCSTRFWYLTDIKSDCKVAYCGFWHEADCLSSSVRSFFRILGVNQEQLIDIRKPTHVKHILVPQTWMTSYDSPVYGLKTFFRYVSERIDISKYRTAEKVYYTRTKLGHRNEVGETLIEYIFEKNGFLIISPENETVEMQIALMNSCKTFASIEGTLAHNIVFAKEGTQQIILQKRKEMNLRQPMLNASMDVSASYIYIGCRPFGKRFPSTWYGGIIWLRANKALRNYCMTHNMWFPNYWTIIAADVKNFWHYLWMCGEEIIGNIKEKRKIVLADKKWLKKMSKYNTIVIYGVNERALRWKSSIEKKNPQKEIFLTDTNHMALARYMKVYDLKETLALRKCGFFIAVQNRAAIEEIRNKIMKNGIEEKDIFSEFCI